MTALRRAADRTVDHEPGITTRHSFSSGSHYDSANVAFGPIVAHDEHLVAAGHGFAPHPHRGIDIVTWVIDGILRHEHEGTHRELTAGSVQYLGAGSGVTHAEGAGAAHPVRFVQMWLLTDPRLPVRYAHATAGSGELVPLVSSREQDGALRIAARGSTLWLARVQVGVHVPMPTAARVHLFVTRGRVVVDGDELDEGDAVRLIDPEAFRLRGDGDALIWQLADTPVPTRSMQPD